MKTVSEALAWRYATKKFDPTKKLSDEQVATLLESVCMAPSSYGLQPFRVILVSSPEVRAKLRAAAWNQSPVTDASHLIVFAAMTNVNDAYVDEFTALISRVRNAPVDSLKGYSDMMKGSLVGKDAAVLTEWAARQAYLAHGVMATTAAIEGIDMLSMEGFDPKQFDEILDLAKDGLTSVVVAAVGVRAGDDAYATLAKVRFPRDTMVKEVK
jgi:nitroreductase / dihydropteridine reductase